MHAQMHTLTQKCHDNHVSSLTASVLNKKMVTLAQAQTPSLALANVVLSEYVKYFSLKSDKGFKRKGADEVQVVRRRQD